ncbi:MAG TPA: hypothetical protein VLU25_20220 [Acidobacteriota bacterium]|nr:hypothetical protein [Acidobacteriota bacterium]
MKTAATAFRRGIAASLSVKRFIFWMWLVSFLLAFAPALILSHQIEDSLGSSAKAEALAQGYDDRWYLEFEAEAKALAASFDPTVAGAGAVLNAVDAFLTGEHLDYFPGVVLIGALYLLVWIWAAGAILTAFESGQAPSLPQCAADGTRYFFRFLRLFVLSGLAYLVIFGWLMPFLEEHVESVSRDIVDERMAFFWYLLAYLVAWILLLIVNLVFDYAKIVTVIEDRRSMLGATLRSLRLVFSHPLQAISLYGLNLLLALVFLIIYTALAPGASQASWAAVIWALFLGQLYIASRIFTRLCFFGSQFDLCTLWLTPDSNGEPAPGTQPSSPSTGDSLPQAEYAGEDERPPA